MGSFFIDFSCVRCFFFFLCFWRGVVCVRKELVHWKRLSDEGASGKILDAHVRLSERKVSNLSSVIPGTFSWLVMSLAFNLTNLGAIYPGNARRPSGYFFCLSGGFRPCVLILSQALIDYLGFIRDKNREFDSPSGTLYAGVVCWEPYFGQVLILQGILDSGRVFWSRCVIMDDGGLQNLPFASHKKAWEKGVCIDTQGIWSKRGPPAVSPCICLITEHCQSPN